MTDEKKEEKKEEKKVEEPETNNEVDVVEKANQAADRLEEATKKAKEVLAKQEQIKATEILDGTTDAGQKEETEEEKEIKEAKKLLEGTGFDKQLFPDKT